jgi:REP element-mobilizing transposase RayT
MKKETRNLVGAGLRPAQTTADGRLKKSQRKPLRFQGYDYSQPGAYFVTVCTDDRRCLFGQIIGGVVQLSKFGSAVEACWQALTQHYSHVELDSFVVMPNHIHGIVRLTDGAAIDERGKTRHGLPEIIRAFKAFSSRQINALRHRTEPVWQRNYYEHIIRNEESLNQIREYIETNPLRWHIDRENPEVMQADAGAGLRPAPTRDDPDLPPFLR